ncbi:MAG: hypothetical protein JSV44_11905 [Candidatus Zixiibacteriota bacterium]|nr:MAG: hypothetical protein JSV44_11905 [candidate division Zixibacteria bacterium]
MTKQLLTLSLGVVLLLAFSVSTALGMARPSEDESPYKVQIGSAPLTKLAGAERIHNYVPPDRDGGQVSLGADAFSASLSPGLQVGLTTYDYQANCRMNRQVDWRGTQNVHFVWMGQSSTTLGGDRGTVYEAWDIVFADLIFKGAPLGGTDAHPRLGGGVNYSGYVGLDVDNDGRAILASHHNEGAGYSTTIWPDYSPLGGFFIPNKSRIPTEVTDFDAADTSQFIWPNAEWHIIGDDTVCHVSAEETLDGINPQKMHYFRRIGGPEEGTWVDPPIVIDTLAAISGTVTASRTTQKVAIVWGANPDFDNPGSTESWNLGLQRTNDLFYRISTNMGASFGPTVNVTKWDSSRVDWALHGDLSALIATDDKLHIIYDARETSAGFFQHFYGCRLFHWAEGQPIRVIKDANWDPPAPPSPWCHGGAWNSMSIVKMQISECDGKFYAMFAQFNDIYNGIDDDCHERAFANNEPSGTANGELYISVSDNDGLNWDIARNLTNSYTAHCDSAPALGGTLECDSDMWPSMARFGMEVTTGDFSGVPVVDPSGDYTGNFFLDVFYVNDKMPGGAVQDAGIWTTNPLKWFRVPCVEPIPNPVLAVTPSAIGDPASTLPGVQLDSVVRLENIGNAPLNISAITVVELDCPHGWLGYTPEVTTVSHLDPNYEELTIQMNIGGMVTEDGVGYSGLIIFDSDSPTSPDTFEVSVIIGTVQRPEYATIHTACKPIYVSNVAQLGNNGTPGTGANDWGNLQFYEDCDTTNNASNGDDDIACYLYEAAPFILRINDDGDTVLSTSIFSATWVDNNGFRPIEALTVDSANPDYQYAYTGKFVTRDSLIALESEFYAPLHPDTCSFIVQKVKVYPNGVKRMIENVFIGELMDWDIPSDSGVENGSDFDASRQMMYHFGAEYGPDSTPNQDCILADQRMGGFAYYAGTRIPHTNADAYNTDSFPDIRGIWTHINPDWVHPSGGFVATQLYSKMVGFGGYEKWQSTNPAMEDSLYQDLNTVAIFGAFDIDWKDTLVFVKILSTSKTGLGTLQENIDVAHAWIADHELFAWPPLAGALPPTPPAPLPVGDVNFHCNSGYRPPAGTPIASTWHELWPNYCTIYEMTSWFDNGSGGLDSCDYIDITEVGTPTNWRKFHVRWVGPTITITRVSNPNDTLYLDYWAYPGQENPDVDNMTDVNGTYWVDARVQFCYASTYYLTDWVDNGNGYLDFCDNITLWNAATMQSETYHVEAFETDMIVKEITSELPETLPEGNFNFDNTDGYVPPDGDPTGTAWHELVPVLCNDWTCTGWADKDGNEKLSTTDSLTLNDGSEDKTFYIQWVGPTLVVNAGGGDIYLDYVMRDACTGLEKKTCLDNPDVNPIDSAIGTYWQQVRGNEDVYFCVGWDDNNSSEDLDQNDDVVLQNLTTGTFDKYAVTVDVRTDIIATAPSGGNCCTDWGVPGDANSDGAINLLDILQIIAFVYQDPVGDPPNPNGCNALLDANGDGTVANPTINLLDILDEIAHVYQDPVGEPVLVCPPE